MNKKDFKKAYSEARKSLREACTISPSAIVKWWENNSGKQECKIVFFMSYGSPIWHNIHFKGDHSPRIAMQCNINSRARNLSPSRNGFGPSSEQFCYCGVKP
ncbi:MAG: hypothetical protein E5Y74_00165 [Mesorhizobium sp.]|nr:MAG: hypothetical protein E5Y74_00165 [Mesorhizobium sp.]